MTRQARIESTSALQDQSLPTATAGARSAERFKPNVAGNLSAELSALRLELALARRALKEEEADAAANAANNGTAADDSTDAETVEYRVIASTEGTYRGHARLLDAWVPHGLGVLTTTAGHARCGQWLNGRQVHHGARYGPALRYEGDFGTAAVVACHGVGLYTFGELFVGCWSSSPLATTMPQDSHYLLSHGLGRLQSSVDEDAVSVDGWFHGLRCAHQCPSAMDPSSVTLASSLQSQPQPLRGLLVADRKLEFWRRVALARALSTWHRLCCDFSIAKGKAARLLALETQQQARVAEQRAVHDHLKRLKAARSQDAVDLLDQLSTSRMAQEQRAQRRQLYVQRLANAMKQRDLAQACVAKQHSAMETLEVELQEITELLKEARQAQTDCAQHAHELHALKRQIENASVKLNAARFEQQHRELASETSQQDQEVQLSLSHRGSVPPTPATKNFRPQDGIFDNNSLAASRGGSTHRSVLLGQEFVCGVPGCLCGIPRDVFLRVSAALKDEYM